MSFRDDITGAMILADWLGAGEKPVEKMAAEFRAQRCTHGDYGKHCPCNVEKGWWDKAKGEIANWVRAELEVKNGLNLSVSYEDELGVCSACGCALPLKVWVPEATLHKHLRQEQIDKTPDYCWMRK